ncbi:MAG: anthranilate synthase family protein [Bifidobacteriaceae bacterium]|jgi:phenazine biosynthesis protein phzE|nr:anthranilate synthase family protein [Bifidobacteriaceae bacterium]
MASLIADLLTSAKPFALIRRGDEPHVDLLTGTITDVDSTADIPLSAEAQTILALVPFRQIAERGFDVVDDAAPLRCLVATERTPITVEDLLAQLPPRPPAFTAQGFDIADQQYAEQVKDVIREEIGCGEGANFVIHRSFRGQVEGPANQAVLAWLGALLRREQGAYWTYAVFTPGVAFAGASPERHLTIKGGVVTMNPISGTYRHPAEGPTVPGMLRFLTDAKEVDELFMVVDEELKLMSAICPRGGRVLGPYLKPMSKVTHTEYLLEGATDKDPREVLRHTMFAPTVTGSPMENACTVIARREKRPRGYYAGVMALFERDQAAGRWDVDAPIMIRTAYVDGAGRVSVPAGATLVRHSDPMSEVAETRTKAAGVLAAIGVQVAGDAGVVAVPDAAGSPVSVAAPDTAPAPQVVSSGEVAEDPQVKRTLMYRNERLAQFWLRPQGGQEPALAGLGITIVDAEDHFSQMLAHQLRHLGARATVVPWRTYDPAAPSFADDIIVAGPGPGDPSSTEPRVEALRRVIVHRLAANRPLLAVCLSHQILCHHLGLDLRQLTRPHQGEQITDNLFGRPATLGYYNTFTGVAPLTDPAGYEVVRRMGTDEVIALKGPRFASLQGHPESALSTDGLDVLRTVLHAIVA